MTDLTDDQRSELTSNCAIGDARACRDLKAGVYRPGNDEQYKAADDEEKKKKKKADETTALYLALGAAGVFVLVSFLK